MNRNNYRLPIFVVIAGVLIIITLSIVYVLTDGGSSKKPSANTSPSPSPTAGISDIPDPGSVVPSEELHSMNGIIKGIDLDNAIITVQERGTIAEHDFFYNGATNIKTAYNRQITAAVLKPGDFVRLSYNDEFLLREVSGSTDVDIYKNVLTRTQDDALKKLTVGDTIYRYGDDLLVLNDGYFVGIDTIEDMDIISLYSVDDYIYLINIEKGHGYFKMVNHSYFNGGTLKIGRYMSCEITDDLYLTLAEDEYDIVVEYEDFIGQATVLVERDMTTVLDMAAYTPASALTGFFRFEISPASALLYIDGILTPYDTAVELTRGEHWIQVAAGGYTPYTGFIEVGEAIDSLNISLSPAPSQTPDILYEDDGSGDVTATPFPTGITDNGGSSGGITDSTSDTGNDPTPSVSPDDNDGEPEPTGQSDDTSSDTGNSSGNEPEPTSPPDDTSSDNGDSGNDPDNDSGNGSSEGSMVIIASEGAAVFIDDVYKGTIENGMLSLAKVPGTHNVRLTKEGYITRRYTIYVEDGEEEAEFSFPEMVAE
ncbi:MAG: PEGA domain-containing protein [Lachnospiraceae bacterium]|nr:PEGA domain-containing protein [Lachnospiraceae bacterium]